MATFLHNVDLLLQWGSEHLIVSLITLVLLFLSIMSILPKTSPLYLGMKFIVTGICNYIVKLFPFFKSKHHYCDGCGKEIDKRKKKKSENNAQQ